MKANPSATYWFYLLRLWRDDLLTLWQSTATGRQHIVFRLVLVALLVHLLPAAPLAIGQTAGNPPTIVARPTQPSSFLKAPGSEQVLLTSTLYLPLILKPAVPVSLVPLGAAWKYLDNGSDQGSAWRAIAFDDSSWPAGPAQLGYGDGDEATVVGYGPDPNQKYITTYFRGAFNIADPADYKMLDLKLLRDDGAVVYLNGQEIARSNLPAGVVAYTTLASTAIGGADESTQYHYSISPTLLVAGVNVLAVEIHQVAPASSDLSFDLALTGTPSNAVRFAVIGDYGSRDQNELNVANLVKSWNPDFIVTVGDNNYPRGESSTIDQSIGQYYADYIYPYLGAYPSTATVNRFFPSLGNHDWETPGAQPYLDYFTLPGNERYYEVTQGPLHLFAIDSDPREPDGITSSSVQAQALQLGLSASTACWKVVFFHHAPYSSAQHGSNTTLQWPFQAWGADMVLAGHDHTYEHVLVNGFPYFVNGAGGAGLYQFNTPIAGSVVRYNATHGAMWATATQTALTFEFIATDGALVDTSTLQGGCG